MSKIALRWVHEVYDAYQKLCVTYPALRTFFLNLAIVPVYYIAANASLVLAIKGTASSPVWPPSGILFAAILLYGTRILPGIGLSVFVTFFLEFIRESSTPATPAASSIIIALFFSFFSILKYYIGYYVITATRVNVSAPRIRDTVIFWGTCLAMNLFSSFLAPLVLYIINIPPAASYWFTLYTNFIGTSMGMIIVTPLLMSWIQQWQSIDWSFKQFIRNLIVVVIVTIVSGAIFIGDFAIPYVSSQEYLLLPVILYVAFSCSPRMVISTATWLSFIAVICTINRTGPFFYSSIQESLLALQLFIAIIVLTMMILSAAMQERNDAEAKLKDINSSLEGAVQQRTKDLNNSNKQLDKVNSELLRSNAELEMFAYTASHDLKSPLRGIDQLASWIADDLATTLDPGTRKHLTLMRRRIKRMENLLNDLLAYAKVNDIGNELVEVNSGSLAKDIFELLAPQSAMKLTVSDNMPIFATMAVPFEVVLRNLISNAIKHNDKPQGNITVSASHIDNWYTFEVCDDGPGIAPIHHQKIFEMFQTLRPRDEVEGSGIGLAMVKKAVEMFGGAVRVLSDGHSGSCFQFTWPDENNIRIFLNERTT